MYNVNLAIIEGNLTRDPEMKALPSGMNVTNMGVATNLKRKDKEDLVEYHNVLVFGKQAESCAKYLTKGCSVLVKGRLQTRSWEKDGVKQQRTEIVANDVTFGAKPEKKTVGNTEVPYPESDDEIEVPF